MTSQRRAARLTDGLAPRRLHVLSAIVQEHFDERSFVHQRPAAEQRGAADGQQRADVVVVEGELGAEEVVAAGRARRRRGRAVEDVVDAADDPDVLVELERGQDLEARVDVGAEVEEVER